MYNLIDELVETISQDEIFKNYVEKNKQLENQDVLLLLSKYQCLQEDYLKMKSYLDGESLKQMQLDLRTLKDKMKENKIIVDYYQSYYQINDLLSEVTQVVFEDISEELLINSIEL